MGKIVLMGKDGKPIAPLDSPELKEAQFHVHLFWLPSTGETRFDRGKQNREPETAEELKNEYDHFFTAMANGLAQLFANLIKNGKERTIIIPAAIAKIQDYLKTDIKAGGKETFLIRDEDIDIRNNPETVRMGIVWEVKTGNISLYRTPLDTPPAPTTDAGRTKEADDHLQTMIYCLAHLIAILDKMKVPKELLVKAVEVTANRYLDQGVTDTKGAKKSKIILETKGESENKPKIIA